MEPAKSFGGAVISKPTISTRPPPETVLLVSAKLNRLKSSWSLEDSIDELEQLAISAGAITTEKLQVNLSKFTSHYIGKGKLSEIHEICMRLAITTVIFDDELSPIQQRNLETDLNLKVIDRTALILDVFARKARSKEGKLQVELAQHEYLLPRLAGQWSHLERLGGGIGTRGPGESQIETDRRIIRRRIQKLKTELKAVRTHRQLYRFRRKDQGIRVVSLIGYTNAGKSTLFNSLTRAGVAVENRLFSTLDPITRKVRLSETSSVLLTDTVGFIQKLPPTVIDSFRATLEELGQSDLLLHIVDVSHKNASQHVAEVERTLETLGLTDKPRILILNKADLIWPSPKSIKPQEFQFSSAFKPVFVSAQKNWGLSQVRLEITKAIDSATKSNNVIWV